MFTEKCILLGCHSNTTLCIIYTIDVNRIRVFRSPLKEPVTSGLNLAPFTPDLQKLRFAVKNLQIPELHGSTKR
jgi:hypothetical protein